MLYWSEFVGTFVYLKKKKIGRIENVMLEPDEKTITGFLLEKRSQDIRNRFFSFIQIKEIKRNCVFLEDIACIQSLSKTVKKKVILSEEFLNNPAIDEKGELIGKVVDIAFDPENGIIKEIILSESTIEDLWFGRKKMPVLGHVEFSRELISVDKGTREEITLLNKGIKNWIGTKK